MRSHPILDAAAAHGMRLGLERVRDMLAFLGDPHLGRATVHVAGTNGKGSVCAMTTAALVAAGHRVGTFLSPHLVHVNERILLDGRPVEDAVLEGVLADVDAARRAWGAARDEVDAPLTYFELTMIAAFVVFQRMDVDVQVVEVGIGGRLDATNLVVPTVCALTTVGLDHVEVLGPDLASIAWEKAGIIKPGVPVVVGRLPPEASAVVARRAAEAGSPSWTLDEEICVEVDRVITPRGPVEGVIPTLAGCHQRDNAAVAVGVLQRLDEHGIAVPSPAIREGARAEHRGRLTWIAEDVVVDGAHNVDGARALAAWLSGRGAPERRTLVFGCGQDRDPVALVARIAPHVARIRTTAARHPKARPAEEVARLLREAGWPAEVGGEPIVAIRGARAAGEEVLVAGSLYLLGDVFAGWSEDPRHADGS